MKATRFLIAATALATAVPAFGGVTVIGSSRARACFLHADSPLTPSRQALTDCDRALTEEALTTRDMVATHVNRGILHVRRGDIDAGLADFDAALARDPKEGEAYLNKGLALLRRDDAAAALPLFDAALQHGTRKPALAYFGRAIAHEHLGDVRAAYGDFRRASELDPQWPMPRAELARFTVRPN